MTEIKKNSEPENDWAIDVRDNPIHIYQAESDAKGYQLLGTMLARHFKDRVEIIK